MVTFGTNLSSGYMILLADNVDLIFESYDFSWR